MAENEIFAADSRDLKSINDLITEHNNIANQSYRPYHFDSEDIVASDRNIVFLLKTKDILKGYLRLYSNQAFNCKNCETKIIILIAPNFRKEGKARYFLNFLIEYIKEHTAIKKLIAEIKYDNIASKNLFKEFQFINEHENGSGCTMVREIKR